MAVNDSTSKANQQREASMRRLWIVLIACILFGTLGARAAPAENVVVGVNVVGPDQLNEQQQDALLKQLTDNGVKVIRTGLGSDKSIDFVMRAFSRGVSTIAIVYPTYGASGARFRPANAPGGMPWKVEALSDANPDGFSHWFTTVMEKLDAGGVRLTAIEFGNEINTPGYNGDFPTEVTSRTLGLADLNNPNDAEGHAVAASYLAYLKVLGSLKTVRDASKLNRSTPIISAGLADFGLPRFKPGSKNDAVSIPDTLAFMKNNGLDNLVDGYGVHVYPSGDPHASLSSRRDQLDHDIFAACKQGAKPCWLTEWGFTSNDWTCPIKEDLRTTLVAAMRKLMKESADQNRLAGAIYYSWTGMPGNQSGWSIFRCGALTDAGKLALSPL
jgi:hypothetical protein